MSEKKRGWARCGLDGRGPARLGLARQCGAGCGEAMLGKAEQGEGFLNECNDK